MTARIAVLGAALQGIYLIDRDDLVPTEVGTEAFFGKMLVGSTIDIDRLVYSVGGGGLNAAVTFSRYGHETVLMGSIADDSAGRAIMRKLDQEAIDNSYMNYAASGITGTSIVLLDSKNRSRAVLNYRGVSDNFSSFSPKDLELIQPDWIYIASMGGDFETLIGFLKKARELGAKVMFKPGAKELEQPRRLLKALEYVEVLLVNKAGAAALVPGNILTELLYHLSGYAPVTIITDGQMGGIAGCRENGEVYRFGIYEDVRVRDLVGAGDAFGSGFFGGVCRRQEFSAGASVCLGECDVGNYANWPERRHFERFRKFTPDADTKNTIIQKGLKC